MIASISRLQSALNFFLRRNLICYGCSQRYEFFHPFKGTTINLYNVTSSCILSRDLTTYLILSAWWSLSSLVGLGLHPLPNQPSLPHLANFYTKFNSNEKRCTKRCKFHGMRKRGYSKYFIVDITLH